MTDNEKIILDKEIGLLRNDLKNIKEHAEAILQTYMRTEAALPSIIYDLKKAGVLKWLKPSVGNEEPNEEVMS